MASDRRPPTHLLRVSPNEYATFGVETPLLSRRDTKDWYGIYGYTVLAAIKSAKRQPVSSFDMLLHGTEAPQLAMASPNRPGYTPRDRYTSVIAAIGTNALERLAELAKMETDDQYFQSLGSLPSLGIQHAEPGDEFQRSGIYNLQFEPEGAYVTIANIGQRDLLVLSAPDAIINRTA